MSNYTSFNVDVDKPVTFIGIYFKGDSDGPFVVPDPNFWSIECPCGVKVGYPLNGLPTVDTPHPCGDPNHWTIKFDKKERSEA